MYMDNVVLGIDIGGTHFRMGLCNTHGKLLKHDSIPTNTLRSASDGLIELASRLDPDHRATSVVAGVPGIVDYQTSKVIYAPNLPGSFLDELTGANIGSVLGISALLVNDADLAAIGEAYFGAGRSSESMAYVTFSTGVGAAVINKKKLLHMRHSMAELGHSFIHAKRDTDPNYGTVEYLASGTALSRFAREHGVDCSNAEIMVGAQSGDTKMVTLVDEIAWNASVALANMVHLFSVETIVIGGGVILSGDYMFTLVDRYFRQLAPKYVETSLKRAALGDNVGLVGAASAFEALAP